jgi:hypothetical protein
MKSIRHYLTGRLLIGLLILLIASSAVMYFFVYQRIISYFDASLKARALAIAGMIEQEPRGVEIEIREKFMPEYTRDYDAEYYQIWNDKGKVLQRSLSLYGNDLSYLLRVK